MLPLEQVIEEYTKVELRGLQSIPLLLNRPRSPPCWNARRLHWSYDGHYYFLSNNCAVETFKLLHDGVPRLADEDLSSITPTGLLRRLKRPESRMPRCWKIASKPYAWATTSKLERRYEAMFEVARQALKLHKRTRRTGWTCPRANARPGWSAPICEQAPRLLLEQAALRRQELLARDELKRRFMGRDSNGGEDRADVRVAMQDVLRLEGFLSRPAALLPDTGYGLPQLEERETLTQESNRQAAQWRQQHDWLRSEARRMLPPLRQAALDATEANVDALGEQLRRLHQEQGGVQL